MAVLSSLRSRRFVLFWLAQAVSSLGEGVYRVALPVWLLQKCESASVMGASMLSYMTGMLFLLPFGGVVADKFPKLRVVFASDVIKATVVGFLFLLSCSDHFNLLAILCLIFTMGLGDALFRPAWMSVVPELVSDDSVIDASALLTITMQVSAICSPMLGAVIVATTSPAAGFLVDAASFGLALIVSLPLLSLSPRHGNSETIKKVPTRIKEGVDMVLRFPWLYISILTGSICGITLLGPLFVALPVLIGADSKGSISVLGLLDSLEALGAIACAVVVGGQVKLRHRGRSVYIGLLLQGAMVMIMGLPIPLTYLMLAMFVTGAAGSLCNLMWYNWLYEFVSLDHLGRIASIEFFGSHLFLPLGVVVSGVLTDKFSAHSVLTWGGSLL